MLTTKGLKDRLLHGFGTSYDTVGGFNLCHVHCFMYQLSFMLFVLFSSSSYELKF